LEATSSNLSISQSRGPARPIFDLCVLPSCPAEALAKEEARRATAKGIPNVIFVSKRSGVEKRSGVAKKKAGFPIIGKTGPNVPTIGTLID